LVDRNTIVGIDFLVIGLVVLGLGYVGAQSIPIAAFGFAVATIGALLLLIVPEPIPQDTYKSLFKDAIANIEIILEESQLRERAYFLRIDDEVRAFIPISAGSETVKSSQGLVQNLTKGPKRFITNYRGLTGLTMIPPGNELVKLSKVEKGDDVEESLRNVIVGFSDLATSVLSVEEGNEIKIQIRDPKLISQSPYFNDCIGSPVSCIACCVISSLKDRPVKITSERFDRSLVRLNVEIME
jgi:hypothetical protein